MNASLVHRLCRDNRHANYVMPDIGDAAPRDTPSVLYHFPKIVEMTIDQKHALADAWDAFLKKIPPKQNLPYKSFLHRRNCSTVPGHGTNFWPIEDQPQIMQQLIRHTVESVLGLDFDRDFNKSVFAHWNLMPDGYGIGAHADSEVDHLGCVFSVTFLIGESETLPKEFQVGRKVKRQKTLASGKRKGTVVEDSHFDVIKSVELRNGDGCMMYGKYFQTDFLHMVPTTANKKFKGHKRLNLTIRPCELNSDEVFIWQNPAKKKRTRGGEDLMRLPKVPRTE